MRRDRRTGITRKNRLDGSYVGWQGRLQCATASSRVRGTEKNVCGIAATGGSGGGGPFHTGNACIARSASGAIGAQEARGGRGFREIERERRCGADAWGNRIVPGAGSSEIFGRIVEGEGDYG